MLSVSGYAYYGIFVVSCAVVFQLVNQKVIEPFIDEIFHLRQCQTYCAYRFDEWDNKITTPPGLYLFGYLYSKAISLLTAADLGQVCGDLAVLRSLNLVGGAVVLPLVLLGLLLGDKKKPNFGIVNVISQPLLYTYYFLFYTDIWATILIILALYMIVREPLGTAVSAYLAALVSFISLWFRQTNILWVLFLVVIMVDKRTKKDTNLVAYVGNFLLKAVEKWLIVLPFVLVTLSFALFVVYNGGITLGDKENHTFNLHVVQVFYCFVFLTVFTVPVWFGPETFVRYIHFSTGSDYRIRAYSGCLLALKLIIQNFTVVHPFLLADNRHYTFYIYRKLLRNQYSWVYMVPIYHFCSWNVISNLVQRGEEVKSVVKRDDDSTAIDTEPEELALSPMSVLAFVGVICLTIIPSPLFEPRYYILPMVIYRIFIRPVSSWRLSAEFAWTMLINAITVTVFLKYEFPWATETSLQRIIW